MTNTVQIQRSQLKQLLQIILDATNLLEEIPKMQDQGRHSEISQHIGAELEGRINQMQQIEEKEPVITELLKEISSGTSHRKGEDVSFEDLEKDVLGE